MRDDVVVFLGPTLPVAEANRILPARFLPPAEQGSVVDAVERWKPRVIVLVDGAFAQVPAVRHKEILLALHRGVRVVGAASLGALRAAELHGFGMAGHGLIYRWYRLTPFADDDEVAVAMTPKELGSQALSEALINMRLTLRKAERLAVIPGEFRRRLEAIARKTHFLERSYEKLFRRAETILPRSSGALVAKIEHWVSAHAVDQKRVDAEGLLRAIAERRLADAPAPSSAFIWTEAFAHDLAASGIRGLPEEALK